MDIVEKIDQLRTRLKAQDAKHHDPEHDLPHIHDEHGRAVTLHGTAGTHEVSELRDELACLADIVRELVLR